MNKKTSSLSIQSRAGYMFGGAAQTTIVMLINVVLTYFYTNVMGINIAKVAAVMLISRLFDGGSDIVAGVIIDRTKSKYGKARPWLLRMALPHFIGLIAMFAVPPHATEMTQLIFIFIAYNFANTFVNTMAGLALSSLNSLMTRDPDERSQLNTRLQANQNISCSPLRVAERNTEDGVIQAARVYLEQLSILNIEISQMCIVIHIWLKEKCLFDT